MTTTSFWTRLAARASPTGPGPASTRSAFAPSGGGELTGPNPTDRGKPGSKYHLLVDRGGIPLAVGLSAANTHDSVRLEPMVDAVPAIKGPVGGPAGRASGPPSCTATRHPMLLGVKPGRAVVAVMAG